MQNDPSANRPQLERALLNTDGGSRGNPGISGIGFTLRVDDGRELLLACRGGAYIGLATNNVAEYQALIWGLENARALGVRRLEVLADSELLVKQLKGQYRVKNAGLKPLFDRARRLLDCFASVTVKHVYREDNSAADALANQAMDERGSVGDYLVAWQEDGTGELFAPAGAGAAGCAAVPAMPAAAAAATAAPAMPATAAAATAAPAPPAATPTAPATAHTSRNHNTEKHERGSMMAEQSNDVSMGATVGAGRYTLSIKEHFDAAHALVGYPGECRNLHGHTWDIEVAVSGTELDEVGIVYDFKALKANLMSILDDYDHKYLNEVPPFDEINATAENLARVIYQQMELLLPAGVQLEEVAVWESPIARLSYRK